MKRKKVINRPGAASRARVDCRQSSSQSSSQSRFVKPVFCSQSTCAGARAREARHPAIFDPEAYFRVWRVAKFGDDFDPVKVAVDEAVAAFSQRKDAAGQGQDRLVWLKIANRIGFERFLDAFDEQASRLNELDRLGRHLKNPAASFQKLLNRRFPHTAKGGAA